MTTGRKKQTTEENAKRVKEHIYDKFAYRWQRVNDASYRLDEKELRSMQKMELALDYILSKLEDDTLSIDECAEQLGYNTSYFSRVFKDYYKMPFQRFVTKLRLRLVAREILRGVYAGTVGKLCGFSTIQSLSKAFRNEFGISPRKFKLCGYEVPDMPLRHSIKGVSFTMEYRSVNAFRIKGIRIEPPMGADTFLMDQSAFIFASSFNEKDYPGLDLDGPEEQVGIYWHEPETGIQYIFGPIIERGDMQYMPPAYDPDILTIQGGSYAVFSYPRPKDRTKIHLMSRILSRFISREWIPMNRKTRDTMSCSYRTFDKDKVCEYVPLSSGMDIDDVLRTKEWSIQSWSDYIDQNITKDLTLQALAQAAHYSPHNYRDIFSMYYGMSPTEYISRRRLILTREELSSHNDEAAVLSKYRYASKEQYEHEYAATFGSAAGGQSSEGALLTDLMGYYKTNKERIKISYVTEESRMLLMHSIVESEDSTIPDDLVGRMVYWFNNKFRDFNPVKDLFDVPEEKAFVWGDEAEYVDGQQLYRYYLGTALKPGITETKEQILSRTDNAHLETIAGGRYAVFHTADMEDTRMTEDTVRLLTRCAFGGYVTENRWRIDFSRRTFIIWREQKLYFYVPIVR